jgi:hypothetical protein
MQQHYCRQPATHLAAFRRALLYLRRRRCTTDYSVKSVLGGALQYTSQEQPRSLGAGRGNAALRHLRRLSPGVHVSVYELAQLNIGIIKGPMGSPIMADFAANLERINALADRSPGFVWRLQGAEGDATAIRPFANEKMLVNMSVWRDLESLSRYVYNSAHVEIMRRRREWFERMAEAFLVLWWVPTDHRPSVAEAVARLEVLRGKGPTAEAFTFRRAFPPPDAPQTVPPVVFGNECPAA